MDSLDDRIMTEPYYMVEIDEELPKTDVIYARQSIIKTLKERITKCYQSLSGDEKILIGFNSLNGIRKIVAILSKELQGESGILCSEDSVKKVPEEYRAVLSGGKLVNKITFMTSSYFAGIDINEKCHVFAVSDISYLFSLLLKAKIYQIFGRPRIGVSKQTFIFNIKQELYKEIEEYEGWLERKVIKAKAAATAVLELAEDDMSGDERDETTKTISKIIESTQIQKVELVRHDKGEILRNNLNLDYLYHRQRAMNLLYSNVTRAKEDLGIVFDVHFENDDSLLDELEKLQLDALKSSSLSKNQIRSLQILEGPYGDGVYILPKNQFEEVLIKLMGVHRKGKVATSVNRLAREAILEKNCHMGKLKAVYQNLLIYRMATLKTIVKVLDGKFMADKSYTSQEIHKVFAELAKQKSMASFSDIIHEDITQKKAVELFNKIYDAGRSLRRESGNIKTPVYKIHKKNIHFIE